MTKLERVKEALQASGLSFAQAYRITGKECFLEPDRTLWDDSELYEVSDLTRFSLNYLRSALTDPKDPDSISHMDRKDHNKALNTLEKLK